jgi:hypothetical protein
MSRVLAAVWMVAAGVSCSAWDTGTPAAHIGRFDSLVADTRLELDRHDAMIARTAHHGRVVELEAQHSERLGRYVSGMRHEAGDLASCLGGMSEPGRAAAVMQDLRRMSETNDLHEAAMQRQFDRQDALLEEARYQADMARLVGLLMDHAETLMAAVAATDCELWENEPGS